MTASIVQLTQEYEKLAGNLQDINESINKFKVNSAPRNGDGNSRREKINNITTEYHKSIDIGLAPDDVSEDENQPMLNSYVVQVKKPVKTRDEFISKQTGNIVARNKRMFGHLIGTLTQFKQESDNFKEKQKAIIRSEIEKKLEEKANNERQVLIMEKRSLYTQQKFAKNKLKLLQLKIDMIKMQEAWEEYQNQMKPFIKTDTYPHLFYRPAIMDSKMQEKWNISVKAIEDDIFERRDLVESELKKLDKLGEDNQSSILPNTNGQEIENAQIDESYEKHDGHEPEPNDSTTNKPALKYIEIKCDFGDDIDRSTTHKTITAKLTDPLNSNLNNINNTNNPNTGRQRNVALRPGADNLNMAAFQAKRDIERKIKELEKRKIAGGLIGTPTPLKNDNAVKRVGKSRSHSTARGQASDDTFGHKKPRLSDHNLNKT